VAKIFTLIGLVVSLCLVHTGDKMDFDLVTSRSINQSINHIHLSTCIEQNTLCSEKNTHSYFLPYLHD